VVKWFEIYCMQKIVLLFCLSITTELLSAQQQRLSFITPVINRAGKGALYNYHFEAMDSAHDPITYTVKKLPPWLSYNATAQTISGKATKAGQFLVQLIARTKTDTAQQNFMITVYDAQTINILCIGNSITNGTSTFNSYRRALWQMLHAGNYNFDFIGSWNKHHMGGEFPNPDFDMDHDGHSGWNAQDIFTPPSWDSIRGNLPVWLHTYTPDIVLMELGTNDVFQCRAEDDVIKNLTEAINVLRNKNSKVKIFVAQIPPLGAQWSDKKLCGDSVDYASRITELNNAIATFGKKMNIVVVDQFTGIDPAKDMYDDIHPNDAGEKIMAERWFVYIHNYLKKIY
jgi:acyl-CoA thioesterase I